MTTRKTVPEILVLLFALFTGNVPNLQKKVSNLANEVSIPKSFDQFNNTNPNISGTTRTFFGWHSTKPSAFEYFASTLPTISFECWDDQLQSSIPVEDEVTSEDDTRLNESAATPSVGDSVIVNFHEYQTVNTPFLAGAVLSSVDLGESSVISNSTTGDSNKFDPISSSFLRFSGSNEQTSRMTATPVMRLAEFSYHPSVTAIGKAARSVGEDSGSSVSPVLPSGFNKQTPRVTATPVMYLAEHSYSPSLSATGEAESSDGGETGSSDDEESEISDGEGSESSELAVSSTGSELADSFHAHHSTRSNNPVSCSGISPWIYRTSSVPEPSVSFSTSSALYSFLGEPD